jgi:hypothetical protein
VTVSDLTGAKWRKSSHSGAGNDCVELAIVRSGTAVRDSKNATAGHLAFDGSGWLAFLSAIKADDTTAG